MPDAEMQSGGNTARDRMLAGLRPPFEKGKSGNRSGRPKGLIVPAINKQLKKFDPDTRMKVADLLAFVLVKRATSEVALSDGEARCGQLNVRAAELIMQHTDPIEPPDNTPREVNVIIANLGQQVQLSDKDL